MSEKMTEPKNIPHNWDYQSEFHTVTCGGCSFRYGAEHPDSDGWWTCPNCGNGNNPARASSPAQEPVTTEPVAWQWWTKIGLINMTSSRSEAESWRTKGADVRPLYAIPAPPQPGREWQSIDTAPKDGTWVLSTTLGNNPYTHQPFVPDTVQWAGSRWNNGLSDHGYQPTHWMPLPAPPDGEPK